MALSREDVEDARRISLERRLPQYTAMGFRTVDLNDLLTALLAHVEATDRAARVAVDCWDEIGQEGEFFVEALRACLLAEAPAE